MSSNERLNNKVDKSFDVADFVIDRLANLGLGHIFFLPGGGCMYLVDAIARSSKIKGVALLHEQSVGIATEAYSQFTNKLSACVVTTGPGATNVLTPCAAAWTDSTPVLFISGQVKTQDSSDRFNVRQLGFQEIPITEIVKPITKHAIKMDASMDIDEVLTFLVQQALDKRPGPVWLDIPLDIQSSKYIPKNRKVSNHEVKGTVNDEMKFAIGKMVNTWQKAKRPLLLIGNGVRLANQQTQLKQLINITRTPALLTWKMIDFLDDADLLNAGRPGSIGQRWSNIALQNADFILCLGARLDLGQVAYRLDNFAKHANKFVCDVDPNEIEKLPTNVNSFNVDLKDFLSPLVEQMSKSASWSNDYYVWRKKIQDLKALFPLKPSHEVHDEHGINLYHFIDILSRNLKSGDVIVPGSSGACSEVMMQAFKVKLGQRILNSEGLGPMGFGLPAALGVAFASSNKRIISVDGDGGFLMNIQELTSVSHHKLPLLIFLLNNNGYGSIKSSQNSYFGGRLMGTDPSSGLGLPNWEKLIRAYGVGYTLINDYESMNLVLSKLDSLELPVVVEVRVEPNQKTEPRVATSRSSNGELVTDDMEDMSPKLDPEHLKELKDFLVS